MEKDLPYDHAEHHKGHGFRLYVIFAQGPTLTSVLARPKTLKHKIRLFRRKPWLMWQLVGSSIIGLVIRSKMRHVILSDGFDAVDFRFKGSNRSSIRDIERSYPGLVCWVEIEPPLFLDLAKYERRDDDRRNWIAIPTETILRIAQGLTFGLIQGVNCMTQARQALADAGINVPRKAHTPPKLLQWMIENGYDCFAFAPPEDSRSTD